MIGSDDIGPDIRLLAKRRAQQSSGDNFAAAAAGLGSTRDLFYSPTGRLPNARKDDTRRQRALVGGPGNRHLGALDLWTEREISRYVRDESEVFEGMIETWATEVVQCGFTLTPKTGEDGLNTVVKEALFGWDGDEGWLNECDARGLFHFWELLDLAEQTEVTDGDMAFFLDPDGNEGRGTVAIIEGDRILTPNGYEAQAGRSIFNGIECDMAGRPVRVFIADSAPEHCYANIEDGRMYDVFDPKTPELGGVLLSLKLKRYTASRRQPWLSTAVRGNDEITDAFVATRIALRNQACRSTYTKISDWEGYYQWLQSVDPNHTGLAAEEALQHAPSPGDHTYLNPGEELQALEATQPGAQFEPFMQFNLRFVGLPLGMGLEEVCKLFDKNFSASRLSLQGTRRRYKKRQRNLKRNKVKPVIEFAIARLREVGELVSESKTVSRMACRFPTWPYIEPLKDAKADRELRDLKVKSSRTICDERGYNFDEEQAELNAEGPLEPATPTPNAQMQEEL